MTSLWTSALSVVAVLLAPLVGPVAATGPEQGLHAAGRVSR
ncbi:hypothetical protein [Nocardiopsis xinjiangensis]|nr:hypothetical protein [Nocardiopsis xinjiangensis]